MKQRLNRIIGQLRGIQKMVEDKRECNEVLQQVAAVKKAIDSLSKEMVVSDLCRYLPEKETKKIKEMVERAINL